jgi:hypothetical protein
MESIYDKVVKLTAEILNKSWIPEPGKVSPFSSSSSMHSEISDNHTEYYVQPDTKKPIKDAIAEIFNSNFWTNGGEKMEDKALNVDSSTTTEQQYNNPGVSTTEPDPQSEIAITKAEVPMGSQDLEGKSTYSTTANTTEQAPAAGDTTEPTAKADGDNCPDCNRAMTLCECAGMSKAAKCPHCGQSMPEEMKKADEPESAEEEAAETKEDEKKEEMTKSIWGGSFAPNIKRGI